MQWTNMGWEGGWGVEIAAACWAIRLLGSLCKKFWCKKGNSDLRLHSNSYITLFISKFFESSRKSL